MKNSYENERKKLKAAFESATLCEEMFKTVIMMASSGLFDENELGLEYFKVSKKFIEQGRDFQKFFSLVSSGGNTRGKEAELKQAFYAATSCEEMIRIFPQLESHVKEENLCMEYSHLTQKLNSENKNPEMILFYGKRALKFLVGREYTTGSHSYSLLITKTLHVLGSACRKLGMYDESLSYLYQCETNSTELLMETSFPAELVLSKLHAVHTELALVKASLGKEDEAIIHMKKMLEIQEKSKPEGSIVIGEKYNVVADLYLGNKIRNNLLIRHIQPLVTSSKFVLNDR